MDWVEIIDLNCRLCNGEDSREGRGKGNAFGISDDSLPFPLTSADRCGRPTSLPRGGPTNRTQDQFLNWVALRKSYSKGEQKWSTWVRSSTWAIREKRTEVMRMIYSKVVCYLKLLIEAILWWLPDFPQPPCVLLPSHHPLSVFFLPSSSPRPSSIHSFPVRSSAPASFEHAHVRCPHAWMSCPPLILPREQRSDETTECGISLFLEFLIIFCLEVPPALAALQL